MADSCSGWRSKLCDLMTDSWWCTSLETEITPARSILNHDQAYRTSDICLHLLTRENWTHFSHSSKLKFPRWFNFQNYSQRMRSWLRLKRKCRAFPFNKKSLLRLKTIWIQIFLKWNFKWQMLIAFEFSLAKWNMGWLQIVQGVNLMWMGEIITHLICI